MTASDSKVVRQVANAGTPVHKTRAYLSADPDDPPAPPTEAAAGSTSQTLVLPADDDSKPDDSVSLTGMLTDRDRYFEHIEHTTSVARLRWLLPWSALLWLGFFFVDFVVATWVSPSPLIDYAVIRAVGVVPILGSWLVLRQLDAPSPRLMVGLDLTMMISASASLSAICVLAGGLTSPYNAYVPLVLIGRAAVLPSHWREAIWRLGIPALVNPAVLVLAAFAQPTVSAQWASAPGRGTYFFYFMLLSGTWLLLVIGGHHAWALRRQVFASRSIGRYRLEKRIGRGGMGEVWQAFHEQLRRRVAVKILRPEADVDPQAVHRFEREIMATAELRHPNTIRVFEHGVTPDGLWYYAMELLDGLDLASLVNRTGPLPPRRAVHLIVQAARALEEAHGQSLVHRDIKPENLFVTTVGGTPDFVKVLDFGIVKRNDEHDPKLTTTGFVAGTPAYVAPEVATGGVADARADVYGLGATLYLALTGSPPFDAANVRELFLKHVHEQVEPPSVRLGQTLPAELESVVLHALAKSPEARYADAGRLADALERCPLPRE